MVKSIDNYFNKQQGERIKQARLNRFKGTVSQRDMAQMLGVHFRTYQNWEIGFCRCRDRALWVKLANILKVDPRELEYGPQKGKFRLSPELKQLLQDREKANRK